MTQKGSHTWDLVIDYHVCPTCKRIIEDRQNYIRVSKRLAKEIKCPYCEHVFSAIKESKPQWALFSGNDEIPDWDWPEK